MEKKGSQGATLSPVKLWSGELRSNTTLNITNLHKYNIINVVMERHRTGRFLTSIIARGSTGGALDDLGDGYSMNTVINFKTNNTIVCEFVIHQFGSFDVKEIWGIG